MGNIDYALGTAQRIGDAAAPLVAEAMGDRGESDTAKINAARVQMNRSRQTLGSAQTAHSRISDLISQIT